DANRNSMDLNQVTVPCTDYDASVAFYTTLGLRQIVDSEPEDQRYLWREAYLSDPAGNRICIFHAGRNRRFPPWRLPA
ncbi:MAG: VOC family protein, partial [Woeseiaceae bacterium]|nr:VOC family protein [Woeseiaceae bacterium]